VSVVFIVLPLAALIVLAAVIAFVASARRGQFDDLETPAIRLLHEERVQPALDPKPSSSEDTRGL